MSIVFVFIGFEPAIELNNNNIFSYGCVFIFVMFVSVLQY